MKAVFFSDAHLNRRDQEKKDLILSFIRSACSDADMVVILGDLFEFYHGYDGHIFPWYKETVDALRELSAKGTRVFFVEGNHEFRMGSYFETYTGGTAVKELGLTMDGKKVFLCHGDEIENLNLARALRSRLSYGIMDFLGPGLTWKVAAVAGLFLSKNKKKKGYNERVLSAFRKYAGKKFGEGYDVVILGHSHMADKVDEETGKRKKVYLNTGDFGERQTYVEYESERGFEVKQFVCSR
jgi:UDP-2,3-diacylglucosamine hydrolase